MSEIPPHRITRLRRQGERYFADGLRELPDNRRLAILAVCAVEWETFLADAVVETQDRISGAFDSSRPPASRYASTASSARWWAGTSWRFPPFSCSRSHPLVPCRK